MLGTGFEDVTGWGIEMSKKESNPEPLGVRPPPPPAPPVRPCTTHHHACDCREAAHAEEVARLKRALLLVSAFIDLAAEVVEATRTFKVPGGEE